MNSATARILQFPANGQLPTAGIRPFVLTPLAPPMLRPRPAGPRKPRKPRKPPVSLSDEQLLALLTVAKAHRQRDYVMILVTYWHGLRASETCALVESDFELDEGTVRIVRGKGSQGGLHDLQAFPENPLLDEKAAVGAWLANRAQFGVKGGANPKGRKRRSGSRLRSDEDPAAPGPKPKFPAASRLSSAPNQTMAKMQQSPRIVTFLPETPSTSSFPPSFEEPKQEVGVRKPPAGSDLPPEPLSLLSVAPGSGKVPFRGDQSRQELLFPISRVQFWRIVHGYALQAGIPRRKCKTHMLKHTIAKHLVRQGHPLNEIQEWMGWSSIETMNWYTRADEEELGQRIGATIRSKGGLRQVQQGSLF
jgi:integrase